MVKFCKSSNTLVRKLATLGKTSESLGSNFYLQQLEIFFARIAFSLVLGMVRKKYGIFARGSHDAQKYVKIVHFNISTQILA